MVFVFNSDFFNWHTSKLFQKTIAVYLDDTLHPKCVSNSMHEPLRICSKVTKWSIASKWCEINYIGVLKVRNLIYRNELEVWFCQNVLYCNTCHHEGTKYIGFINHHSKCSTIICLQNQHHINIWGSRKFDVWVWSSDLGLTKDFKKLTQIDSQFTLSSSAYGYQEC